MSPMRFGDCIENLLHFTLASSIDGSLDIGLGLSKHYCSNLLRLDPTGSTESNSHPEGVPSYPLYKHLATVLHQSFASGAFYRRESKLTWNHVDNSFKEREGWNELIQSNGSEIENILKTVEFELHVQEPFFSQLKDGQKTTEGRCAVGKFDRIQTGDLIIFNKCLILEVQDVHKYSSFAEMLEAEGLSKVLPGVDKIEEGVQIYRKFYTEEEERSNGVLAIAVAKSAAQPCISLARCLYGLSLAGVQSLLCLMCTTGTIPEGLPPPRSILFSSFMSPHKPNVKGNILTKGARALAKHVNRSNNSNWWGLLSGSDYVKNELARGVISRLIDHCCWMNVHIVPPHGVVFEIRVSDGYGARWSENGTKFIGFLEPYMDDGHSMGWMH